MANLSKLSRVYVSNEMRKKVIELVFNQGFRIKQVSELLILKKPTIYGICKTFVNENRIEHKHTQKSGRKVLFDEEIKQGIGEFFKLNNAATIRECQTHIQEHPEVFGDRIPSKTTIDRLLKRSEITMKNLEHVPKSRNSLTVINKRFDYVTDLLNFEDEGWSFIYVDEFGCNLHTTRKRGRNLVGKPAIKTTVTSRGANLSTCAAISSERGVLHFKSKFCAYNNAEFVEFLDELVVKLNQEAKTKIIMDNASFHHHHSVVEWFDRQRLSGFELDTFYLPAYSPMLNPIEECFSKVLKAICQSRSTSSHTLVRAVDDAFSSVSIGDCAAWSRHSRAYHGQCLRKVAIDKQAERYCPPFRVIESEEEESDEDEDEIIRAAEHQLLRIR